MEKEIWKDIEGYEGLYQVSNFGRIKSLRNNIILKQGNDHKGYLQVGLRNKGYDKTFKVHRLVARSFIPNPNNLPQVNHINGIKTDNRVDNLEWCTQSYNVKEAYRLGLMTPNHKGTFKKGHNITFRRKINQYDLDGNFIKSYKSILEASKQFSNISNNPHCNISSTLRGIRKTAFGYIWRYAD